MRLNWIRFTVCWLSKTAYLIAEGYFNEGSVDQKPLLQSVSKSYISALVSIAIEQECISGTDARLVDFFPEISGQMTDPDERPDHY